MVSSKKPGPVDLPKIAKSSDLRSEAVQYPTVDEALAEQIGNQQQKEKREHWDNSLEFLFSCIGMSVGLGNIWRFPYIAYVNGGAAFLIPYLILMITVGKPMYFLELILGQFQSQGQFAAFNCFPLSKGVGVAMGYACFFVCLYFNIILAYAMVYIVHSLKTPLPWTECNPEWADDECFVRGVTYNCKMVEKRLVDIYEHKTLLDNDTIEITYGHRKAQVPFGMYHNATMMCTNATQTSVEQFFYKAVLSISKGIEYPGAVKPDLTISLFLAWVIVCISLSKGIKTSGKIVYVTAPAPYIILAVLLIRGVTLPGSLTGIAFFLIPDWEKMLSFQVWQAACQQMFYSLGVSMGPIICLGSYNNFRNDLRRDITIITFADFITSIFGGLVVFSVLGNMAHNLHVDIEDVAEKGHGLAFVTYPEAASLIKWPNLWAFAFFFMLFLLAVDSQFAMFESVLVPLKDEFPLIRGNSGKFLILLSLASFLMGISMTTQGGLYVLNLIDSYLGGMIFPIIAVFELYTVCWFYGIRNLSLDIEFMLGSPPGYFVKLCWGVICPIALTVIVFVGILTHSRTSQGSYVYPLWADVVGFLLLGVGLVQIPIFAFMYLRKNDYDFKSCLKPSPDWGPYKVKHFRDYKEFLRRKQLEEEDELKPPGTSQESPEPSPEPITPEQPRRIAKLLLTPLDVSLVDIAPPMPPPVPISVQVLDIFRPGAKHTSLNHLQTVLNCHFSRFSDHLIIATDASVSDERAGVGIVIPQLDARFPIRLPDYTPVYESEFLAMVLALLKVPPLFCHCGLPLNEAADTLAKMALSGPVLPILPPVAAVVRARYKRYLSLARPPPRLGYEHLSFAWNPRYCHSRRAEMSSSSQDEVPDEVPQDTSDRERWSSNLEFLLSCVGMSVGLGNIWRFPYMAYANGGAAFLLAYTILMLTVGKPMYFLELILGQFQSSGQFSAFNCFPLGKGIGISMAYGCFFVCLYFNVVLAYAMIYMVHSFKSPLPWTYCNPEWADEECFVRGQSHSCRSLNKRLAIRYRYSSLHTNDTVQVLYKGEKVLVPVHEYRNASSTCTNATRTSAEEFFNHYVLSMSDGIEHPGRIKWDLTLALFIAWMFVCLALYKGIKTSGKIALVTTPAPYLILFVLLIRGVTLPGAATGISYFLVPQWKKIMQFEVWQHACQQMFYSLGVSMGTIICLGSFNDFRHDLRRDLIFITFADFFTSVFGGMVVFSVLGNMAHRLQVDIEDVAEKGHGLAFIAYPEAASMMGWPNLWALSFFFMLVLLAVDSQFAMVESVLVPFKDEFPTIRRNSIVSVAVFSLISFLLGISMTTQGGIYVLNLLDTYLGGMIFPIIAVFELYSVCWLYGFANLSLDIEFMLGSPPGLFLKVCWCVICPVALTIIVLVSFLTYSRSTLGSYVYPEWADALGVALLILGLVQIPIFAFVCLKNNDYNITESMKPSSKWGPHSAEVFAEYKQFVTNRRGPFWQDIIEPMTPENDSLIAREDETTEEGDAEDVQVAEPLSRVSFSVGNVDTDDVEIVKGAGTSKLADTEPKAWGMPYCSCSSARCYWKDPPSLSPSPCSSARSRFHLRGVIASRYRTLSRIATISMVT
ncbi:uncharacterized protein LOC135397467 [Ornithodoros turicata]|uniref:uncharacterized protein LOC135397467 n=1 Tax=Ornithodoros turicata TaxID=34597 RepID=UPI0031387027